MTTPDDRDEHEDHEHIALPAEYWESVRAMRMAPNPFLIGQTTADLEVARALFDNDLRDIVNAPGPPPGWHTLAFCHLCAKSTPGTLDHMATRRWLYQHDHPDRVKVYAFDPSVIGRLDVLDRTVRIVPDGPPLIIGRDLTRDYPPPWARRPLPDEIPNPVGTIESGVISAWSGDGRTPSVWWSLAALTLIVIGIIALAVWA